MLCITGWPDGMCWLSVLMGTLVVQRLLVNPQDAQEKKKFKAEVVRGGTVASPHYKVMELSYSQGSIHPSSQASGARQVSLAPAPFDICFILLCHLKFYVTSRHLEERERAAQMEGK